MQKKVITLITFFIFFSILGSTFLFYKLWLNLENKKLIDKKRSCPQKLKTCPDGSVIYNSEPDCQLILCPGEKEGILISSPKRSEKIKSPLKIEGQARGFWFFEGEFIAELYDDNKKLLGKTILRAKDNWMTENFVPFEGELIFSQPSTNSGILRFLSSNPSGLPEHQKIFQISIQFEKNYRKVFLYYYNPQKDLDENGNIKCSEAGLVKVEKYIPISKTPIKDTIEILLRGKENLSQEEIEKGITTEFPLEGLKLKSVNLKPEGLLFLEFEDPLNKTSGGSCRVKILWSQIEATAKQFPEVKKVQFLPEYLFQP